MLSKTITNHIISRKIDTTPKTYYKNTSLKLNAAVYFQEIPFQEIFKDLVFVWLYARGGRLDFSGSSTASQTYSKHLANQMHNLLQNVQKIPANMQADS